MQQGSSAPRAFSHARIITPETEIAGGSIVWAEGRVFDVRPGPPPDDIPTCDLRGLTLAPGFIDIHVHGGGGFSLVDGDATQLHDFARWVASRGVAAFLPALVPDEKQRLLETIRSTVAAFEASGGAKPLGVSLEGPFLNPLRCGALNPEALRAPDMGELNDYLAGARRTLRLMTMAAELPGADEVIAAAVDAGVVVALGHSDARYDEAMHAFEIGVSHVTHAFNAMRPFHHREPGCLGAAFDSPNVTVELIADGVAVHAAAMNMLLRLTGVCRTVLVSDGIALAGCGDGDFELGSEPVKVRDGAARMADGRLAGGVATMDVLVRNAVRWLRVSETEAVRMATLNPAAVAGVEGRKGRIAAGYDADLVVLSPELEVEMTLVGGRVVYERQPAAFNWST